jgi:NAD(P)H dehydrogenase (quinone)
MKFANDVKQEIEKVIWASYIVVVTPYWWGGLPAILKGWFDRVFVAGLMWDYEKHYKTGM